MKEEDCGEGKRDLQAYFNCATLNEIKRIFSLAVTWTSDPNMWNSQREMTEHTGNTRCPTVLCYSTQWKRRWARRTKHCSHTQVFSSFIACQEEDWNARFKPEVRSETASDSAAEGHEWNDSQVSETSQWSESIRTSIVHMSMVVSMRASYQASRGFTTLFRRAVVLKNPRKHTSELGENDLSFILVSVWVWMFSVNFTVLSVLGPSRRVLFLAWI